MRHLTPLLVAVLVGACSSEERGPEGTLAGECSDGADNDVDTLFDCNDPDCAGAPACVEDTAAADDDDDRPNRPPKDGPGDDTGEADTGEVPVEGFGYAEDLTHFALAMRVVFDLRSGNGAALCDTSAPIVFLNECYCAANYYAEGTLIEADLVRNTYDGRFEVQWENCDPLSAIDPLDMHAASIWTPGDGVAYTTFRFRNDAQTGDLTDVSQWIAHRDALDTTPSTNPFRDRQYWVDFNGADGDWDPLTTFYDYEEDQRIPQGPGVNLDINSKLRVAFSEGPDIPEVERFEDVPPP